ncbi:hypothetical protein CPB84DRAFT_1752096 [Gymnopilus junonius]|uniref:DUF6532 domain-containing protein n=1 Tax=Gymnopilus junonius TaxID=109634 RepID=A0A9P5NCL8_GYMJU|nr:hypothetical protein CPB84DRAFT_1752096 [Gymnopilus junonius]
MLGDIVLDHQSHVRTPACSVAFCHIAGFELGIRDSCTEKNLGFMDLLKEAFFESCKDFGFKYIDEFKSSIEKRPEPELTIPIVTLAATGYFVAIQAWESGKSHEKAEKFEGELFNATFKCHVSYLESIKKMNLVAFHVIMSRLYNHAIGSNQPHGSTINTAKAVMVANLSGHEQPAVVV